MSDNINIKNLNIPKKKFFMYWLQFLKPYHKLRDKEIEMLSLFLNKRYELSEKIKDDDLLDTMLFDKKIKDEIREEMNYSSHQVFNNMLSSLRSKGVIINGKINKGLIPELLEGSDNFKLIFNFNIRDEIGFTTEEDSRRTIS
tara:strand:- start:569 stop:997 length:429 start_codon:yes stop_codon:yes gene_type:complete